MRQSLFAYKETSKADAPPFGGLSALSLFLRHHRYLQIASVFSSQMNDVPALVA